MDFHVNQATNQFVRGRGLNAVVTSAGMKARDTLRLDVYFNDGSTALVDLAEGAELVFAIKTGVESDADLLAQVTEWTRIDTGHYRAWLPLNTEPLVEAIGDLASISAVGELTWQENPEAGGWESTNTLAVRIDNDVYKGTEGTPLELPGPEAWLAERAVLQPLRRLETEGDPRKPLIRIAGITHEGYRPIVELTDRGISNTKDSFADYAFAPVFECRWITADGGYWYLTISVDFVVVRAWKGAEDVPGPHEVETWVSEDEEETETPVITYHVELPGQMVGQLCVLVTDTGPYRWYIAYSMDPTRWDEITHSLIFNRDTGSYERLFIQDGIIQTEVVTP